MAKHANTSAADAVSRSPSTIDTVYAVLADEHRRAALDVLCSREDPVDVGELARAVLARAEDDSDAVREAGRHSLRVSMYHVHVPKLAEAGLVSFDREAAQVAVTDVGEEIRSQVAGFA